MDRTKHFIDTNLYRYICEHSLRLNEHQHEIVRRTMELDNNIMLGSLESVQHFQLILKAMNAKKCLEVGCYTGSTTLSLALALPEDGKVVTLDITDKWAFQDIWKQADVDHKIELIVGPAVDSLENLVEKGEENTFDFAFIDADKDNYLEYYERCLKLVRKGGLICLDNVLWNGDVVNESSDQKNTKIMRKVNAFIKNDDRVDVSLLPIGDGVFFCYKK